jgi:hypothetical protein
MLSDLREIVPFTYDYDFSQTGCGTTSYEFTEVRTAYVRGTSYLGLPGSAVIASPSGATCITFTFPELLLTLLTPGDIMTVVIFVVS